MPALPAYAVLFDLDGTLLDSTGAYLEIMRAACAELGWPAPGPELMRAVLTHRQRPIEALLGPCDDLEAREAALFAATARVWQPLFNRLANPFPQALELLDALHRAGMRLGIVTDANDQIAARVTAAPGCPPLDTVVTRARAGARKPSPAGIRLALEELGVAPEAVIYVGDNPCDVEAARAAGVRAVAITTGASLREDLEPCGAEAVIDGLDALAALLRAAPPVVTGCIETGRGEAGGFLGLPWAREQLEALLGGPFHPGTVNLRLSEAAARVITRHRHDAALQRHPVHPQPGYCRAHCHAVELAYDGERLPALTLWPEVDGYPDTQLELICAPHLRQAWSLADGHQLTVHYRPAPSD